MGGQIAISTNEAPLFDGTNYLSWRENMKRYLKSRGSGVWDSIVSKPWHLTTSKRKTKTAKEARRNNSVALKAIQDGLSDQVKENMRHYKSAKELWLQLENCYQNETQEEEKSYQSEEQDSDKKDSRIRKKTLMKRIPIRIMNKTQKKRILIKIRKKIKKRKIAIN
jgi:hypothetical protein